MPAKDIIGFEISHKDSVLDWLTTAAAHFEWIVTLCKVDMGLYGMTRDMQG